MGRRRLHWAWAILGMCFANLFINYSVRLGYGVVLPEMIRTLGFSRADTGWIYNSYLLTYISVSPFTGYLTDLLGARRVVTVCLALPGCGAFLLGTVEHFWTACLFFGLAGLGATGLWVPIIPWCSVGFRSGGRVWPWEFCRGGHRRRQDRARGGAARNRAVMTRADHPSGTDRIAEAAAALGLGADQIIVNVQGDEPLIDPGLVSEVAATLERRSDAAMSTACYPMDDEAAFANPNVVKVVFDAKGYALYFSRAGIPYRARGAPRRTAISASTDIASRSCSARAAWRPRPWKRPRRSSSCGSSGTGFALRSACTGARRRPASTRRRISKPCA